MNKEQLNNSTENISILANELEKSQSNKNEGRGVQAIRNIISDLRRGDLKSARAECFNQSDKIDNYPDIKEILITELFQKDEKHPWSIFQ